MAGFKSVLNLRRNREGHLQVKGDPPKKHVFPTSLLERALGNGIDVEIVLNAPGGPARYRMTGFERHDDGQPNVTGWVAERVED